MCVNNKNKKKQHKSNNLQDMKSFKTNIPCFNSYSISLSFNNCTEQLCRIVFFLEDVKTILQHIKCKKKRKVQKNLFNLLHISKIYKKNFGWILCKKNFPALWIMQYSTVLNFLQSEWNEKYINLKYLCKNQSVKFT